MQNQQTKYTIKEVSKSLKISIGKLREWENMFPEALYVQRTKTGARMYTDHDLEMLKKIKLLKDKNINEENVKFILDMNSSEVESVEQAEDTQPQDHEFVEALLELQTETNETLQNLTETVTTMKKDFIDEVKKELKNEMNAGHHKTKSLIQSYSHIIVDTAESTKDELSQLRQDIHREEEEKLFIQQKLEEREMHFQEFVQAYRETAAAKQKFPNWLVNLFKQKKENSMDFS
ncbi:MerR family transcriptional regulator [Alkalihalobacillus sp. MEB130]|uniref:MerR family transcriptional regulator n=1 Tax=Alkalihalobacillus sp. MEB130 TaxID=2976704 RepID=UPI0028DFADEF|nr:MerR family transcriptional regulator [Alkalihalobacillus sp. MEB130]MDT8859650.1 MerR family transcriptional regulator [Alkalihalobacillus sp. MEB130]